MENLLAAQKSQELITILVVSGAEHDAAAVQDSVHDADCVVSACKGCTEALRHLRSGEVAVVLCDREVSNGSWQHLLAESQEMKHPPVFIVSSRHADEHLWAEVLNLGGYDVLLKPFDRAELGRVLRTAARHWPGDAFRHSTGQSNYMRQ